MSLFGQFAHSIQFVGRVFDGGFNLDNRIFRDPQSAKDPDTVDESIRYFNAMLLQFEFVGRQGLAGQDHVGRPLLPI